MKRLWVVAALVLLVCPAPVVEAEGLASGLAVAVTSDGKRLIAGGRNRALYELDPGTLAVKRRVYLGNQIQRMAFSPTGKALIVESTKVVQWLAADTLAVTKTWEQVSRITLAPAAGLVAVNSKNRPYTIKLLDIETGDEKANIAYNARQTVSAFALSSDGKQLAILYRRKRDDSEKTTAYKDIPRELTGAAKNEFQQRADGYTAEFLLIDVATGKPTLTKKLWYGAPGNGNIAFFHGGSVHVIGYENQCASIDAKGEVTCFELPHGYNYARYCNADGSVVLAGGLRDASRMTMGDRNVVKFEIDKIPGFPEYFKSFDMAADGTAYAGTTASRVIRIGADAKVQASQPVY